MRKEQLEEEERIRKEKEEDRIRMEKEADEFAKALENQALKDATSPPTKASAKVNDNSPKTDGVEGVDVAEKGENS